ncbi:hypothetical protein [Saccharopolyspora kobensis]|uniref:hypothetical protein n=1 Tax=Saccharopolyspora kobensis TaxID=146035 RepID=UPI00332AB3E4
MTTSRVEPGLGGVRLQHSAAAPDLCFPGPRPPRCGDVAGVAEANAKRGGAMADEAEFDQFDEEPGPDDESAAAGRGNAEPDVLLDVPDLRVDEISLEVEDLRAKVSLQAEVLDLVKLNVGADVHLGRVALEIKGVEAQALLKVRLDNVAGILERVLQTIDRNPQILENLTQGLGSAVREVGEGAGSAVRVVGAGAGGAVREVGEGAGEAVRDVGEGAGSAVEYVGESAGEAVRDVGEGAGSTVEYAGESAGEAVRDVSGTAREATGGTAQPEDGATEREEGTRKPARDERPRRPRATRRERSR